MGSFTARLIMFECFETYFLQGGPVEARVRGAEKPVLDRLYG